LKGVEKDSDDANKAQYTIVTRMAIETLCLVILDEKRSTHGKLQWWKAREREDIAEQLAISVEGTEILLCDG
jgi:hypothetical protein